VSPEVVVIASFPLKGRGTEGNAQVRGVSPKALAVRPTVKIVAGRVFQPGLTELLVGRNVAASYVGLELGKTVRFGGGTWTVVGVFDSGGTAYDSELWCDFSVLRQVYQRPQNMFQSATARLSSPDALTPFKDALTADPRVTVQIDREIDYYSKQSRQLTTLITVLGTIVAVVMGIGAVFGALNTMYSAIAERARAFLQRHRHSRPSRRSVSPSPDGERSASRFRGRSRWWWRSGRVLRRPAPAAAVRRCSSVIRSCLRRPPVSRRP
jgi:putative ABC transport system permease protein